MQYESSSTNRSNLASGLKIQWTRTHHDSTPDKIWEVVCYSDESRWLFDNSSAEEITLLGEVRDGLNTAEILETDCGAIIALYADGIEAWADREAWMESMPTTDRPDAERMLSDI